MSTGSGLSATEIFTDLPEGIAVATSALQQKANDVRATKINWTSYLQGQMISREDYEFITKLDNANPDQRKIICSEQAPQCALTFLNLLGYISKDATLQYILTMIDDLIEEDASRVEIFNAHAKHYGENPFAAFFTLLNRQDGFITNQASRIIAKLAVYSKGKLMEKQDLHFYLNWLKEQLLNYTNNGFLEASCRCLQLILRLDPYRKAFVEDIEGLGIIATVLSCKVGFQVQYQLTFCLWCLTFNHQLADKMTKYNLVPIMADILSESAKEKVTRIILALFHNLLSNPTEPELAKENALAMVTCKVLKTLELLENRKFEDDDITEDIEFLKEQLEKSFHDLSSFDEYSTEIKSGRLEWSPVHTSVKFWRENAEKLNDKNYELLKILIRLLETSKDPLVLCVANHDIGEYVRHYPRGKNVVDKLGGKQMVMQHLVHEDPNVRYEALLAVQKIMVHNWEYLGKQLNQPAGGNNGGGPAEAKAAA